MRKVNKYKKKIRTILNSRLEFHHDFEHAVNNVIIWLCCECDCGQIDLPTFSLLKKEVVNIADEIMRRI